MATILIADDDPDIADLARRAVLAAGHHVLVATDGAAALAMAGAADLVVLDVSMPVIDGHGVIAHLRAAPHTRDLPVVVLSSLSSADEITTALDVGADDYVTKPFMPFELRRRVERLLDTSELERRLVRRQGVRRREARSA